MEPVVNGTATPSDSLPNPRTGSRVGCSSVGRAATLILSALLTSAATFGQQAATGVPGAQNPAPAPNDDSLPKVTINAQRQRIERRVHTFVYHATVKSGNDSLALWHVPICPSVEGLRVDQEAFFLNRLGQVVKSAGAPLAPQGCRPNFRVFVTPRPEALLKAWVHGVRGTTGGFQTTRSFVTTPRPVRVWYNAEIVTADGTPLSSTCPGFAAVVTEVRVNCNAFASRLRFNEVLDFYSLIVIVDLNRLSDFTLGQVVDYIAMVGLTKINLDADLGDAPTILRLFGHAEEARLAGLSDWDESFLKALYHTDATASDQPSEIAHHMLADVSP